VRAARHEKKSGAALGTSNPQYICNTPHIRVHVYTSVQEAGNEGFSSFDRHFVFGSLPATILRRNLCVAPSPPGAWRARRGSAQNAVILASWLWSCKPCG
jgi:hypothetical protein